MTSDDDLEFDVGDVLKLHPSPRLKRGFRMRVTERVTDDAGDVIAHGPQISDRTGQEGHVRKVLLAGEDEFTVEQYGEAGAARLEKRDTLTAAEVRALGRAPRSKWSNMADWYANGWIRSGSFVMCRRLFVTSQVKPLLAGVTRRISDVKGWGRVPFDGVERWVLTSDRATRLETWIAEQNGHRVR